MREAKNFDTFYQQHLLPVLPDLRQRSQASRRWQQVGLIVAVFNVLFFTLFIFSAKGDYTYRLPVILFTIGTITCIAFYTNTKDDFTTTFKTNVIGRIIAYISPDISYEPDTFINHKHYKHSALARLRYTEINGDDMFRGVYKGVQFKCSELTTILRGNIVFNGLFFYARINPYFNSGTYVWSKGNEQIANSLATEHYRFFPMPDACAVKMQEPEFDKYFTVYSTYPAQTREILNDERMQQMLNYYHKINKDISFSFVGGYCYVAVPARKKLFESGTDPGDKEKIKEYFTSILLFLSFIDKLSLYALK